MAIIGSPVRVDRSDARRNTISTRSGEATVAVPFGGAGLKSKWGTPDIIGAYKPLATGYVKFGIELVSAEVKIDLQAPIVAFGQAVAYRLSSTKTYIAMPASLTGA